MNEGWRKMRSTILYQNSDSYSLFQMAFTKYMMIFLLLLFYYCSNYMAIGTMTMNVKAPLPLESSTPLISSTMLRKVEETTGGANTTVESKMVHWEKLENQDEVINLFPQEADLSVYYFMGTCNLHERSALHRDISIMLPAIGFHDDEKVIVVTYLPEDLVFSLTPPQLQEEDISRGVVGENDSIAHASDSEGDAAVIINGTNHENKLQWPNRGTVVIALDAPTEVWDTSTFLGTCNSRTYTQVLDAAKQYALDNPIYQPFSVSRYEKIVVPSNTPDDFVWSIVSDMTNFGVVFHPVLEPKKVDIILYTNRPPIRIHNSASEEISGFYTSLEACLGQRKYESVKNMADLVMRAYKFECLMNVMYLPVVHPHINGTDNEGAAAAVNNSSGAIEYLKIELFSPRIDHIVQKAQIYKQQTEKAKFTFEDIVAACLMLAIVIFGSISIIVSKADCWTRRSASKYSKLKWAKLASHPSTAIEVNDDGIEFLTAKLPGDDDLGSGPYAVVNTELNYHRISSYDDVEEIDATVVDNPDVLF